MTTMKRVALALPGEYMDAMSTIRDRLRAYDIVDMEISGDCTGCDVALHLQRKEVSKETRYGAYALGYKRRCKRLNEEVEDLKSDNDCLRGSVRQLERENILAARQVSGLKAKIRKMEWSANSTKSKKKQDEKLNHYMEGLRNQAMKNGAPEDVVSMVEDIRRILGGAGISIKAYAAEIGYRPSTVYTYLNRIRNPKWRCPTPEIYEAMLNAAKRMAERGAPDDPE